MNNERVIVLFKERVLKMRDIMREAGMNNILITSPATVFYLTGKWIEPGERMMVFSINEEGKTTFFINELFPVDEDIADKVVIFKDGQNDVAILNEELKLNGTVGIDKYWPAHFLIRLLDINEGLKVKVGAEVVDKARTIKDSKERELMQKATDVNDSVMGDIIEELKGDMSEVDVCRRLSELYRKYGTEKFSFHPLIAYGGNGSEPHHDSDNTMLKEGDSIIIDIGGRTNNYCSDMTRTVFYKSVSDEHRKIYNIVLQANRNAIEKVKPGATFKEIDLAARDYIEEAGYGKYFTHRTGHNIGIDVHEGPDVSCINEQKLEEGMIFSIEPGIYIPGEMGVRIEDLVLVTKDGYKVLNNYSKELTII